MTPRHIALALLVVLIWGLNFVVIHEGLAGMPPLLFVAIRFACILPIMAFVPRPQVAWRDLALVGLLMSAGQFGFLYSAMAAGLASGLASLILQAQALFTVVIAAAVLGGAAATHPTHGHGHRRGRALRRGPRTLGGDTARRRPAVSRGSAELGCR